MAEVTESTDERGMSVVVGKVMEVMLVVLYIGLVSSVLYGGVVPAYQTAAGAEIADRTLADVATDFDAAIPPPAAEASVRVTVDLPATIDGDAYRIIATDERLVLEHPSPRISTAIPLVLPARVVEVSGQWESGGTATLRVRSIDDGLEVTLA